MKDDEREQMIALLKTDLWPTPVASDNDNEGSYLDRLVRLGFSITHDAIRDHSACETCGGFGIVAGDDCNCTPTTSVNYSECPHLPVPCPGGSPVTWEAEA